ncbi:CHRD domain-containing protein [Pontibacter pamirensis]|uniref:CHRD domain-containing protein n=1 Tax=Pontibacter pamirensis TaxID=2562824 RepID=UPI00138A48A2|nr:CHRD domain-containing protein [Pontibacter pamirensis]
MMAVVLFSLTLFVSSCDDDDDSVPSNEVGFNDIALTGEAEVQPNPVITDGEGELDAVYNLDTRMITYNITWELGNADDKTTGMHFHGPASLTESASVVIPIQLTSDSYTGSVSGQTRALTQVEEDQLLNGLWYLNIHSTTYPAGELRGQLD